MRESDCFVCYLIKIKRGFSTIPFDYKGGVENVDK